MADVFATVASLEGQTSVFPPNHRAYVQTFRDWFRMDVSSSDTRDGINILTPGAGPGRWRRLNIADPSWMQQLTWVIDSSAGNDENSGVDLANAIKTDDERRRRMGTRPYWSGEYHLRYVSDIDYVLLSGHVMPTSIVFLHGSMTSGQGAATLLSATADTLIAQNPGVANTPYQVTANAIPVSWTASGYSATGVTPTVTVRCRLTSGNTNIVFWPLRDLGSKTARCTDTIQATTFTAAGLGSTNLDGLTYPAIAQGNTFVIERLTQIGTLVSEITNSMTAQSFGEQSPVVVFESLKIGKRDSTIGRTRIHGRAVHVFYGCELHAAENPANSRVFLLGCTVLDSNTALKNSVYHAGGSFGTMTHNFVRAGDNGMGVDNWMIQGGSLLLQQQAQICRLGIFDSPTPALQTVAPSSHVSFFLANAQGPNLWGSGNTTFPVWLVAGSHVTYPAGLGAGFTITGGGATDIAFPGANPTGKTAVRAFNDTIGLYTEPRNLTWANVLAAVTSGGFGGHVYDPATACYFGESGAPNAFG